MLHDKGMIHSWCIPDTLMMHFRYKLWQCNIFPLSSKTGLLTFNKYCSWSLFQYVTSMQFGTQVKFRWSRDHNNRTAENAFSAPWYYSEMELKPVAGWFRARFRMDQHSGTGALAVNDGFLSLYVWSFTFAVLLSLHFCHLEIQV